MLRPQPPGLREQKSGEHVPVPAQDTADCPCPSPGHCPHDHPLPGEHGCRGRFHGRVWQGQKPLLVAGGPGLSRAGGFLQRASMSWRWQEVAPELSYSTSRQLFFAEMAESGAGRGSRICTAALPHWGTPRNPTSGNPPSFPLFTPLNHAPSVLLAEVSTDLHRTLKADQQD